MRFYKVIVEVTKEGNAPEQKCYSLCQESITAIFSSEDFLGGLKDVEGNKVVVKVLPINEEEYKTLLNKKIPNTNKKL